MALSNGIMTGAQAAKVNSYPTLSNSSDTYLNGAGQFTTLLEATSAKSGFLSAADKAFIDALKNGTLKTPTVNSTTGALEYKYGDTVILSVPLASGS